MSPPTTRPVTFPSGDSWCQGWLTLPEGDGPHPALMVAHGFGMTAACNLDVVTRRLGEAGIASIAFDYRTFGASLGQPRQVLDLRMQRDDYRAALAHARTLPELDADRLGLWGTSFSGGHVLSVAATEPGLAAVVAQVPFTDGPATRSGEGVGDPAFAPPPPTGPRPSKAAWVRHGIELAALAVTDALRARLGRSPVYVPIAGDVGTHAVMAGPGSLEMLRTFIPDGVEFDNRVSARIALQMMRDVPRERAADITAPLLVCVVRWDRVTPPEPAIAAAAAAPRGEVMQFDFQHLQAYQPPHLDELLDAEIAWLRPLLDLS